MTPGHCSPTGPPSSRTASPASPALPARRKQGTPGRLPPCRLGVPVKEGCAGQVPPWPAQPSPRGRPAARQTARQTARHRARSSILRGCAAGGCPSRPSRPSAVSGRGWRRMHGDGPVHCAACRPEHPITADCPVDCLARLLSSRVFGRLARAEGRHGEPVASCGPPATVGDVVRLYRQGRLGEISGLGAMSVREVGLSLVSHGLVAAGDGDAIMPGCPVDCLRTVISGQVLNRLARADGRRSATWSACTARAGSARSRAWVPAASPRSRPAWSSPGSSSTPAPRRDGSRIPAGPRLRPPPRPVSNLPQRRAAG